MKIRTIRLLRILSIIGAATAALAQQGGGAPARLVKDIDPTTQPAASCSPSELVAVGSWVYFTADDGSKEDGMQTLIQDVQKELYSVSPP